MNSIVKDKIVKLFDVNFCHPVYKKINMVQIKMSPVKKFMYKEFIKMFDEFAQK